MSGATGVTSAAAAVDDALAAFAAEVGDADQGPVAVEGSRTRWDAGGALDEGTRAVKAPEGVVAYRPEEMTVTVRAGTTVAELHEVLAVAGQRTALPERGGTVGGALAVGESDLCALGRGPVRNALLQVRYVSADGRVVTGGGPTVKNVTGFDLPRLMVGSLGTLGCLAEVILRTNPVPPEERWLASDGADPFAALGRLLHPGAVLWDGRRTWVLLAGHPADVAAEAAVLAAAGDEWEEAAPPPLPPRRWSLPPAALHDLDGEATGGFVASVGVGVVFAEKAPPSRTPGPAVRALADRVKAQFDPTGRLNPGRRPGGG